MGGLLARVARRPALAQIRYVAPVRPGAAPGPVAEVYAQMERDFGMLAPPVALHAAAPDILAAIWLMLRESTLVPGALDRAAKEAIATAVSAANACPYCVEVHGTTLAGSPPGGSTRSAIRRCAPSRRGQPVGGHRDRRRSPPHRPQKRWGYW